MQTIHASLQVASVMLHCCSSADDSIVIGLKLPLYILYYSYIHDILS